VGGRILYLAGFRMHLHRDPGFLADFRDPFPGPGVAPPLSAWFGYASPSGQGRSLGRSTLVIDTGAIHGGSSRSDGSVVVSEYARFSSEF
jgi:hypothetical protein